MSRDPWDERFGFFWYNDEEIFHFDDDDFRSRAKSLAEAGTNHVITFSCTHFRWSFRRYWEELNEVIRRIVSACHDHGIAVTEHHSSHLTFNPLNREEEEYMERVLNKRGSTISSWPHLREDCDADPEIHGHPLSSFRQIDGRTGTWARSRYHGWCMCFNNPHYRSAYLSWLESVYRTGVDGIMTDDVQYFALEGGDRPGHACACVHCRKLFFEETGFELPEPGDAWDVWHGDYENPSYLAWIRFRIASVGRFHQAVAEHYESLGKRLLRPNYQSSVLNANPTAYCLEDLPRLDWIFQENCNSDIIRYSWPSWAVEAAHRYAVGRTRKIPPMSLFYPDRKDSTDFSWALAMSWGHLYLGTSEGRSVAELERPLRRFEIDHADYLHDTTRISDVAFYYSRESRVLDPHAVKRSLAGLMTWAQSCCRGNIPFTIFRKEDLPAGRSPEGDTVESAGDRTTAAATIPVLVVNDVVYLDDEELRGFARYLRNGGTLVWTGGSGSRRPDGTDRTESEIADMLGIEGFSFASDGGGDTVYEDTNAGWSVVTVPGDRWIGPYASVLKAPRWQPETVRSEWSGDDTAIVRGSITSYIDDLLDGRWSLHSLGFQEDVLTVPFVGGQDLKAIIHYVNAAETLNPGFDGTIGHEDSLPFPRLDGGTIELNLRRFPGLPERSGDDFSAFRAILHDPEGTGPRELQIRRNGEVLSIMLSKPPRFYGLIIVDVE